MDVNIPKNVLGIDGLIGCNKSPVLQILKETRNDYYIVEEPIAEFCKLSTTNHRTISPIDLFYKNDIDAFALQMHIVKCWDKKMQKVERDMLELGQYYNALIYSRSPLSCMVFAKTLYRMNKIGNLGWEMFRLEYNDFLSKYNDLLPSFTIYFDTPVANCLAHQRRKARLSETRYQDMEQYLKELRISATVVYEDNLDLQFRKITSLNILDRVEAVKKFVK